MASESEAAVRGGDAIPPLKSLGKYLIERKLGQGGMGTVYLARHVDLRRTVAIKVLPRDKARNSILVRRFKAEAQAAAQLEHPNIVSVYDTGEADGYLYIAMEYVDGIDLFEHLKKRRTIPVQRSIEIVRQVALALQHAYEQNIVHRDIKPSNLLVRRDGVIKITDLGLARSIDDSLETNITRAGTTVGTVDYMSPEQARNSKLADTRSDIYSLGCTWYQMLTGIPPYPDGSMTNKLHAHAIKPLPDPREFNDKIPEGLFAVLQRMTAKRPDDRYQTPAEFIEDLDRSKLTNKDFSDEIFSDLSDDEIEIDADQDEEIDEYESDEPRKKPGSRPPKDIGLFPDDVQRRRSRNANDDDQFDSKRKKRRSAEDDGDSPQTGKPRQKSSLKSTGDDPNDRSAKKRGVTSGDSGHSLKAKSAKNSAGGLSDDKLPTGRNFHKPLPPKRQPISNEIEQRSFLNADAVKLVALIGGIVSIIIGLGWLMFRWGDQMDTINVPIANKVPPAAPVETKAVPATTTPPETVVAPIPERPVVEFDIAKQPLPTWATTEPVDSGEMTVVTVGPGAVTANHFNQIADAVRLAEKSNVIVKLVGSGPFFISNIELTTAHRLVIAAATADEAPLIIVSASDTAPSSGLIFKSGELDLRGVHFVINQSKATSGQSSVVAVTDGKLFVRNCSVTVSGDESNSMTAFSFTSNQDSQIASATEPLLLIDRVTVRGNGVTGLKLHRTTADVVVKDSLMVTGTGPAVDLAGHLIPSLTDVQLPKPRRIVRLVRSTLCGRKQILQLAAENTQKPPTTELFFLDTVCAAEGVGHSALLASATRWPSVSSRTAGWLTNLNWTSVSSLYLGFDQLLELDKNSFKVNVETWQRVWNKRFEPNQFQSIHWKDSLPPDLSAILPVEFDNAKLPYQEIKSAQGQLPGCAISELKVPSVISQSRLQAISQRPKALSSLTAAIDGVPSRRVDANKDDLGAILNRADWQSGATFEVFGFGNRAMSPARILDKSLKIIIFQADGPPLKIQAKVSDSKSKPDFPGLITIENGTLELQSLVLESPQISKPGSNPWLISAKNSNVVMRGCQLNGPLQQDIEQQQGLIQWSTTNSGPSEKTLTMNDCFLSTTGAAISGDISQGKLFLQNCLITSKGDGLKLLLTPSDANQPSDISLEHVTFSTNRSAIRLESTRIDPASPPTRLFVDYCAVIPSVDAKESDLTSAPAFVESTGAIIDSKLIEWWGNSNGVSKDIPVLLRRPDSTPVTTVAEWNQLWGENNDLRLLIGADGVRLATALPNKLMGLKPGSFQLDLTTPSASWADGGRPIGADVRGVENALEAKKLKDLKPGPSTKPGTGKPGGTKPGVGF